MHILDASAFEAGDWKTSFKHGSRRRFADPLVVELLTTISKNILTNTQAREHPDLATFGYFCRPANIKRMTQSVADHDRRFGWGTTVHIAPSNIPINFAFSFCIGLLTGNSNMVRLPSRQFPQSQLCLQIIDNICKEERFADLRGEISFFQSERSSARLEELVASANGLVVWGGDGAVATFRQMPKPAQCVEVYFPNRVSSAVINSSSILASDDNVMKSIATRFFNDSYLVDQNACSSPSIIFWVGTSEDNKLAQKRFWDAVGALLTSRYQLDPVAQIDKHLDIMRFIDTQMRPVSLARHSDQIWTLAEDQLEGLTARFGTFAEVEISKLTDIETHLRPNEQTLSYFGYDLEAVTDHLVRNTGITIDRIVAMGSALDFSAQWDGKNLLNLLSRVTIIA